MGFVAVFLRERKDYSRTLYYSLIIMKSLPLRGCRQIAKPCKYCLVRVIVFFDVCFFYFFVSHRLGIWVNSLQLVSEPGVSLSGSNGRGSRKDVWNRKI